MNWTKTVCVGIAFAALVVGAGPIHAGDRFQRLETKTIPFVEALALTTNRKIGAIFAWPSANISHDVVVDFVGGPDYEDASGTGDRPQVSPGELEAMMRFARNPWDDDATHNLKVVGSNPTPATKTKNAPNQKWLGAFFVVGGMFEAG